SDSGATWSIQPSGVVADLIAGSAYNDQVCWLVGRAGTILRTTDGGATWQKITAPTSVDLVSVFAINAQSATITDDAAHSYQTSSAGARWSRTLLSPHQ
ncbi:MAG: YCF48-related protein, partial [Candidatus Acidiferrum sp.]